MGTVARIIEKKGSSVYSIDAERSVLDAARLMNERRVGALVVVRGEKVVGIFTERDILNRVVAQQRDPADTKVADVMTSPVTCASPDATRAECRHVMRTKRIRHLPVVDNEKLVGIVSIGDLVEDDAAAQQQVIEHLYEYMNIEWK